MPRSVRVASMISALAATAMLLAGCSAASADAANRPVEQEAQRPVPTATATPFALPSATEMSPTSGSLSGGDTVTITGTSLTGVTGVTFDGVEAQDVTVVDENTVTAVAPRDATYQPGDAEVELQVGEQTVPSDADLVYEYQAVTPVDHQMQYALTYWKDYNDGVWGDFNPRGGDCANFVSQTLVARGWTQTSTWYNNSGSASSAWSFVPSFDNWLRSGEPDVTRLSLDERDQVKVGDVAVFSWSGTGYRDHVMIVSDVIPQKDGSNKIELVGHNLDYDFRDLDETLTEEHPGGIAWFYSIPE